MTCGLYWLLLVLLILRSDEFANAESACVVPDRISDQRVRQPILYVFTSRSHPGCQQFWHDYFHGPAEFRQTLDRHFRLVNTHPRHLQKHYELPVFMDERNHIRMSSYSSWKNLLVQLGIPLLTKSQQQKATPLSIAKLEEHQPDPATGSADKTKAVPLIIRSQVRKTLFKFLAAKMAALLPIGLGSAELLTAGAVGGSVGLAIYFGLRGMWHLIRRKRTVKTQQQATNNSDCKNCEQLTALLDNERAEWQRLNTNYESTIDDLTDRLNKSE